jgi:hypothetical protein
MNNSVFSKSMEKFRNRVDIRLVNNEKSGTSWLKSITLNHQTTSPKTLWQST